MRSPQLKNLELDQTECERYSDLVVMRSNAGWYVGTHYDDPEMGRVPGSRDSDYHATREDAEATLAAYEAGRPTDRPFP